MSDSKAMNSTWSPTITIKQYFRRLFYRENFYPYLPSGNRKIFLFLNLYFPMTFVTVLIVGAASLLMDMPNKLLIPPTVLFFSLVLIKKLQPKQWVAWACILTFPLFVYLNRYSYSAAIACWYPILMNFFIVSMLRINLKVFSFACTYFLVVHFILVFWLGDFSSPLWLLNLGGSFLVCSILVISLNFIRHNQILLKQKNKALRVNHNLLENLRTFVKTVLHDQAHWAAMSHIGLAKTRNTRGEVDDMLEKGLRGIHQLANRLRKSLKTNHFAHLQVIPITELMKLFKNQIKGSPILKFQWAHFPKNTFVRTDPQVLVSSLFNLVQNAAAANANRIEIELVEESNFKAALLIRDNGCGLSQDTTAKLFQHRIKNSNDAAKGTGLMGVQFSLNCMDCGIHLENPNIGGKGWTVFKISGLEIFKRANTEENDSHATDVTEKTASYSYD